MTAERGPDAEVVVGQVVLGEQVHFQRDLRDVGQATVRWLPGMFEVVAALLVRDELVREPLGHRVDMPVETARDDRFQLVEQGIRRGLSRTHGCNITRKRGRNLCKDASKPMQESVPRLRSMHGTDRSDRRGDRGARSGLGAGSGARRHALRGRCAPGRPRRTPWRSRTTVARSPVDTGLHRLQRAELPEPRPALRRARRPDRRRAICRSRSPSVDGAFEFRSSGAEVRSRSRRTCVGRDLAHDAGLPAVLSSRRRTSWPRSIARESLGSLPRP